MNIECKSFNDLSLNQLYDILQLREEVFEIEQSCIYPDMDNKDKQAHHLMLYKDERLLAYARLLNKGISYTDYSSIGRVCTHSSVRKEGYGKQIMEEAIQRSKTLFSDTKTIKISAQSYLLKFYSKLGFTAIGDEYLEDDIPHIGMIMNL